MRPRLSARDRAYLTFLAVDLAAVVYSARYWWRAA
jgi:hypothetical protein